jgi:hypothetical protein
MKSQVSNIYEYPLNTIIDLFTSRNYVEEQYKKSGHDYLVTEHVDQDVSGQNTTFSSVG